MMSGLTVGFMSIDKLDLELKLCSGTPSEKRAVNNPSIIDHLGTSYLPDLKEASLLAGDLVTVKRDSNGSFAPLPRPSGPLLMGCNHLGDGSPLLRRDHPAGYLHRAPVAYYCGKGGASGQTPHVGTGTHLLSYLQGTR